jgi:AraC-like DNA-binding protein
VLEARPGHDRVTRTHDRDALVDAVQGLHVAGAIFLRAEYREAWAYESLTGPATAQILRPGSDRLVLFHVVASGTCWVTVGDGEKHWATAGDVIVLPYGDQHRMGGVEDAPSVPLMSLMEAPPWLRLPVIRHGPVEGRRTDVICGFIHSEDPLFDPRLRVFPRVFVVRPATPAAAGWLQANIAYALDQAAASPLGPDAVPSRLPELLLVEVLREHLRTAPAVDEGWVAALHDPVLRPALAELHRDPARRWSVDDLARAAATSRTRLDARFREVLGRSPIRYLTEWRLHLAQELLATTDLSVAAVARRVGYDAEEAFSRAFRRTYGEPPGAWRSGHWMR